MTQIEKIYKSLLFLYNMRRLLRKINHQKNRVISRVSTDIQMQYGFDPTYVYSLLEKGEKVYFYISFITKLIAFKEQFGAYSVVENATLEALRPRSSYYQSGEPPNGLLFEGSQKGYKVVFDDKNV